MAVGDLAITKGIPYLGKKSVEAGRYYASEAMRDPNCKRKQYITLLTKPAQSFKKLEVKC